MLELGCGTARVTAPLAARTGTDVVGIDIDLEMLAVARSRYAGPLFCGDMRRFALRRRFPLIVVPYSSIQLLDDDGRGACFHCVAEHLEPDGVVALEIGEEPTEGLATDDVEPVAATEIGGVRVLFSAGLVVEDGFVTYQRRFDLGGAVVTADVKLAAVTRGQITREAEAAGISDLRFLP